MDIPNNNDVFDLGSAPAADDNFDPFATDTGADTGATETTPEPQAQAEPPVSAPEPKDAEKTQQSLMDKPPVFEYAGATENIDDTSQTFDELRIAKAADFPELEDGKRVSWTVEYGKVIKTVADPKGTSIGKMKTDIEDSKAFTDALKKAKDKSPACKVKPRVTAQSKGVTAAYKGVYNNLDEAEASGKLITLFPAKDGNVYEMRHTEMGRFITLAADNGILQEVKAGFTPALPPIPAAHLRDIVSFFKMMARYGKEALANIYWDKQDKTYITDIPRQSVSMFAVKGEINPAYDNDRYIHYMDIHSHHDMRAFFSAVDDADEKATRVYAVIGNVLNFFPEIRVRISNGGKFLEIEPGVVFEDFHRAGKLALTWFGQIQYKARVVSDMLASAFSRHKADGEAE